MNRPQASKALKPLCECAKCTNKGCPNVLEKIPISRIGQATKDRLKSLNEYNQKKLKASAYKRKKEVEEVKKAQRPQQPTRPSLMDILNHNADCACELMARAAGSDIPARLGLARARDAINRADHNDHAPEVVDVLEVQEVLEEPEP